MTESYDGPEDEFELEFCEVCYQMTNHLNGECQKCKSEKSYD